MKLVLCDTYEQLSEKAAELISEQLNNKPDSVLGFATGSTPLGLYKKLVSMHKEGKLDFSHVTSFNLDEYYPIKRTNPQSYYYFMQENLFSRINIPMENIHIPDGEASDADKECEHYESAIKAAGCIDLQILGIGQNGHIGFNEPDDSLIAATHVTALSQSTIDANSRFFSDNEEMPNQAITMGMSTILNAKKIVLLASGANKSHVVNELLNSDIKTSNPATFLKLHPDVTLICDKESYSGAQLGVDIGGTNIKFVVLDNDKVVYKNSIKTAKTCQKLIDDIASECEKVKELYNVKTIGVGTPGYIRDGRVTAVNLAFCDTPLAKLISEKTHLPVKVENDANCAALGEVRFGSAQDCQNIILITLGTGVGGGIIMNKKLCCGKNSMGEIGHMIIQSENGLKCPCGLEGCFEQYASVTALIRQAEAAANKNKDSILYDIYKSNGEKLDGEKIFEAIDKNCAIAVDVFNNYVEYLAIGIKSLVNILGPDAIILAGGITKQNDKILTPLKSKIDANIRVEISSLQNDAGSLGAAIL